MSEMIERVAQALAANSCSYAAAPEFWRVKARAAIEAMTVPTATMREAGGAPADTTWHLMINAALA